MTAVADTLSETMRLEFDLACRDVLEAEAAVREDDGPVSRAHLAACRAQVDAVLDMWNEAEAGCPG
jgi:hypothetical protein